MRQEPTQHLVWDYGPKTNLRARHYYLIEVRHHHTIRCRARIVSGDAKIAQLHLLSIVHKNKEAYRQCPLQGREGSQNLLGVLGYLTFYIGKHLATKREKMRRGEGRVRNVHSMRSKFDMIEKKTEGPYLMNVEPA